MYKFDNNKVIKLRTCKHCSRTIGEVDFAKVKRPLKDGHVYQHLNCCMTCFREIRRISGAKWRKNNPEGQAMASKKWYAKNKQKKFKSAKSYMSTRMRVHIDGKRRVVPLEGMRRRFA